MLHQVNQWFQLLPFARRQPLLPGLPRLVLPVPSAFFSFGGFQAPHASFQHPGRYSRRPAAPSENGTGPNSFFPLA